MKFYFQESMVQLQDYNTGIRGQKNIKAGKFVALWLKKRDGAQLQFLPVCFGDGTSIFAWNADGHRANKEPQITLDQSSELHLDWRLSGFWKEGSSLIKVSGLCVGGWSMQILVQECMSHFQGEVPRIRVHTDITVYILPRDLKKGHNVSTVSVFTNGMLDLQMKLQNGISYT